MPFNPLGLDIGGANLKAAHADGAVLHYPFELWRNPILLPKALTNLFREMPSFDCLAITMTGELCDCFETKAEGVSAILDAVVQAAGNVPARVWTFDGFLSINQARVRPYRTAAANWFALATFAGRFLPTGPGLVLDIGSTTTDLAALRDGKPCPSGWTDPERLRHQELIYTGVSRTPVCALLGADGASEWFATMRDVYVWLGEIAEEPDNYFTADGRPSTRQAAKARLARMLCGDVSTCTEEEIDRLARVVRHRQIQTIREGLLQVCLENCRDPFPRVLLSGAGEFLGRAVLRRPPCFLPEHILSLSESLGPAISQAACAYALARLALENS